MRVGVAVMVGEPGEPPSYGTFNLWGKMPKFVIERDLPGAGRLSAMELKGISQKSCGVLRDMGPSIIWQQSYVADDKIYCVYIANDEEAVRKHAQLGGFPATSVMKVSAVIDPSTAE